MRDITDLMSIKASWSRHVVVDLEQLESIPKFRTILETLQSVFPICEENNDYLIRLAVREYIADQIQSDSFPQSTPGTTGPGVVYDIKVEVNTDA